MHQYHFLIPDPESFPSGGNVYNAHLIRALVNAGVHVSHGKFNPDVLLASPDTHYILDSIYFERITNPVLQIPTRCIGLIHHLESLYPLSDAYFEEHERHLLNHFSGFIATSRFTFQYLVDHGFDPAQIVCIEPAPGIFPSTSRESTSDVRALMLGSCIPRKGQLRFLHTLAKANITEKYALTIAGSLTADVLYAKQCREVIESNEYLKRSVHLIGEQVEATIQQLYAQSNLYVSSSEMETFGMAIQDAVMCRLPVLALEGGYAAEHIEGGVNGRRCHTFEQLVDEYGRCVVDREHFFTLQKRANAFTPTYESWSRGAEKLMSAFPL